MNSIAVAKREGDLPVFTGAGSVLAMGVSMHSPFWGGSAVRQSICLAGKGIKQHPLVPSTPERRGVMGISKPHRLAGGCI